MARRTKTQEVFSNKEYPTVTIRESGQELETPVRAGGRHGPEAGSRRVTRKEEAATRRLLRFTTAGGEESTIRFPLIVKGTPPGHLPG